MGIHDHCRFLPTRTILFYFILLTNLLHKQAYAHVHVRRCHEKEKKNFKNQITTQRKNYSFTYSTLLSTQDAPITELLQHYLAGCHSISGDHLQ